MPLPGLLFFWVGSWLAFRRRWAPAAIYGTGNVVYLVYLLLMMALRSQPLTPRADV